MKIDNLDLDRVLIGLETTLEEAINDDDRDGDLYDRIVELSVLDSFREFKMLDVNLGNTLSGIVVFQDLENLTRDPVAYLAACDRVDPIHHQLLITIPWEELGIEWSLDADDLFQPRRLLPNKGRFSRFVLYQNLGYTCEIGGILLCKNDLDLAAETEFDQSRMNEIVDWIASHTEGKWNLFGFELKKDMMFFKLSFENSFKPVKSSEFLL